MIYLTPNYTLYKGCIQKLSGFARLTLTSTYSVDALVPHAGSMSLLDEITGFGEEWLSAAVNITATSTFADEQGVPAWIGIEYMAQCIAAFSGVQERTEGGGDARHRGPH